MGWVSLVLEWEKKERKADVIVTLLYRYLHVGVGRVHSTELYLLATCCTLDKLLSEEGLVFQ